MTEFLSLYLALSGFVIYYFGSNLLSFFLYFCSIYSYVSLIIFKFGYIVPFDLGRGLSEQLIAFPIFAISSFAIAFSFGNRLFFKKSQIPSSISMSSPVPFKSVKFKSNLLVFFPLLSTLMVILSVGIDNLLYRTSYVVSDADLTFRKYADITVWLAIATIPFIKNKILMLSCHIVLLLAFIGLGSRSAIVIALSYPIFNYFINGLSKLKLIFNLCVACVISVAVMSIRFKDYKGIIPVFDDVFSLNIEFGMTLYLLNYITSYSILLFSEYLSSHILNYNYFFMSLNPLPGFMLDIDGIDQWARFRKSIPHSALSQLVGHVGLMITFSFFIFHGVLCGYLKNRILRTFGHAKIIVSSLLIIDLIFLIPVIRAMQYNLRGVARLEYLVLILTFFLVFILYFIRITRKK
ncbi:hypothetical protein [Morganella morganii]|uniref:hypothetical protein n=1 Tax=Morganella morganii TaxID=582 RepID=UPI0034D6E57E